jgi:hypothetical protein
MATSDSDPASVRFLNRLGKDLESSGLAKAACAVSSVPSSFYDIADIVGIIYQNPLVEARLSRYPGILGVAERPESQDLAGDQEFSNMRLKQEPISSLVKYPKVQALLNNQELLKIIWATLAKDSTDLRTFLETGNSQKYGGEPILGRWKFNVNMAMAAIRRTKPNISSTDMQKVKRWMAAAFAKTSLVAMPGDDDKSSGQAILKETPQLKYGGSSVPQTLRGQWKGADGKYQLSLSGGGSGEQVLNATISGDRLTAPVEGMDLVFDRED